MKSLKEGRKEKIKKMKINKFIAMLGAAAMLLPASSALTVSAARNDGLDDILTDGAFEYLNVDGGYKITKCSATIITKIPAVVNGVPVVSIGENAFATFTGIEDLVIPDSVKTIEKNAFYACAASSLTLPKNLKTLGEGAFTGCENLTEVKIPDSLTEIPESAFRRCFSLSKVEFGSGLTTIGDYAFYECTSLERLDLPPTLTEIGGEAFGELLSLSEITADGSSSFAVNDGILTDKDKKEIYCGVSTLSGDLHVPDGTEVIRPGAFSASASIEHVFLPSSLTEIGEGAFSCLYTGELGYCSNLKSVDFANGLETIGDSAFAYTMIESLSFPTTLKTIGNYAFNGCYALNKVVIPDGLKTVGDKAFFNCNKLKKIAVPKSVSDIGERAFGFGYEVSGEGENAAYEEVKVSGFKMSVPSGSAAKKYAKKNGVSYTTTDFNLLKWAFIVLCFALLAAAVVFGCVLMSRSRKTAPLRVRQAKKREKERAAEASYKKIIDDSEPEKKQPQKKSESTKKPSDKKN